MKTLPFAFTGLLLAAAGLPAATVDTADNTSTGADGKTSLLEALTNLTDGETISFAIPGPGPHYIATPEAGYPLITKSGVFIDGYSQTGATANTAGIRQPNNAHIDIVLDSRTETPGKRRTVIDYDGFSDTESCVLGLLDAQGVRIRGLAFIGVAGSDSNSDPYVYNIALIRNSSGSKIQGCWFGLDPSMTNWTPGPSGAVAGVYGARSAVASFKGDGFTSIGLVFGNDGDGNGDRGEFNLCMAQRLAIHLQTPAVRVSGNWINVFPDGSMLRLESQGLTLEDETLEAIENGDGTGMIIGTDGNGTGDADEGNIIGPLVYDTVAEFWGTAPGIVFAGNSVGVGLDGFPAFSLPDSSLVSVRKNSSVRIGGKHDTPGNANEANHIHGIGKSFISWHGSNNDGGAKAATISLRGNELINNFGGIPLDSGAPVQASHAYEDVMADPFVTAVTLDPASTTTLLQGSVPPALSTPDVTGPVIDVYIADAFGLYQSPAAPQGRSYLGSYVVDGPGDLNLAAGSFSVNIAPLNLTAAELARVTITANYTLSGVQDVTTSFSPILGTVVIPPPLGGLNVSPNAGGVQLQWTGGTSPFRVDSATDPAGPWAALTTTEAQFLATPLNGPRRFYRVREGAPPR